MNVQYLSMTFKQVTFYYTKRREIILDGLTAVSLRINPIDLAMNVSEPRSIFSTKHFNTGI
ncbi:hypothetical protein [Motilimonas sp. 1_MG-2023]|uniref:hypothetical protein n=1 Tax=Motilimonas TaxID=1914248 RepID=UPI0026E2F90F|nr:hypothetical protein [Motilimonas sp. 1_MG-2023]MDO6524059.1 hypothetical protein [Motilimonas sp. 1_MG-2023]